MKKNILLYIALGIFSVVFIVCAVIIVDYLIDVAREKDLHSADKLGSIGSILEDTENTPAPVWTRKPQSVSNPDAADSIINQNGTTTLEPEETTGTIEGEKTEAPSDTTESVSSDSGESSEVPSVPTDTTTLVEPSDTTLPPDDTVIPPTTDPVTPDSTTSATTTEASTTVTTPEQTTTTSAPTVPEEPEDESQYSEKFKQIRKELLALNAQYPDIMGYILIPSLGIKYPLMNRPEDTSNLYYLTHDETGRNQKAGSIYTDYRVKRNPLDNKNLVIYGHNMRSGSMFGTLSKFVRNENMFNQGEIIIATIYGIFTYKVFSAYTTNAYDTYCTMNFANDEAHAEYLNSIIQKSAFESSINDISTSDNIITLSTCTNITDTGRYAVHAVLIKIEK